MNIMRVEITEARVLYAYNRILLLLRMQRYDSNSKSYLGYQPGATVLLGL